MSQEEHDVFEWICDGSPDEDSSQAVEDYMRILASGTLQPYQAIIHTGGKAGESLWSHIINLVMVVEQLRKLFSLSDVEMRGLLLALTIHDINKVDPYGKRRDGLGKSYANAAKEDNLRKELHKLGANGFFSEWGAYLKDIKYLSDAHQEMASLASQYNERYMQQCLLQRPRLEGPLRNLMKAADVADNTHSGTFEADSEAHIRVKLLNHINIGLASEKRMERYRFIGHRLSDLRGIETNVIHNVTVSYFKEKYNIYGPHTCIDLLYHPEGVDYLLDQRVVCSWTPEDTSTLAQRIWQRLMQMQEKALAQFVKAKPSGISVDPSALQSGATIEAIFTCIHGVVERKRYQLEWCRERAALVRRDLESYLQHKDQENLARRTLCESLLKGDSLLVSEDEEQLKRGEFLMAYRNFLKDHRSPDLKKLKLDAWKRASEVFALPSATYDIAGLIDPYRRAYFMARDLPEHSIHDMVELALRDLSQLHEQVGHITQKTTRTTSSLEELEEEELVDNALEESSSVITSDARYLLEYLERHFQLWESQEHHDSRLLTTQAAPFDAMLQHYARARRQNALCCYCGSTLPAEEWMAMQVPPYIGVQSFSNRLDGGSSREPKRNVCGICRTQFLLEKLAWESHRDKQGKEKETFYLHCFPYTFFTQPLLLSWWKSIRKACGVEHGTFFFDAPRYLRQDAWQRADIPVFKSRQAGFIPSPYAESISNTPVMPLIAEGKNYGIRFLFGLEQALVLAYSFGCRVILSKLPTPLLNLSSEKVGNEPVALFLESAPKGLDGLLPATTLTQSQVQKTLKRLGLLYQLAALFEGFPNVQREIVHTLLTAASRDQLELYYEVDRLIEKRAMQKREGRTSGTREQEELALNQKAATLLDALIKEGEKPADVRA